MLSIYIPKIIEKLLNLKHELKWGLNPEEEENDNFTAVWLLENYKLSVYKQADICEKNNQIIVYESSDEVLKTIHLQ